MKEIVDVDVDTDTDTDTDADGDEKGVNEDANHDNEDV